MLKRIFTFIYRTARAWVTRSKLEHRGGEKSKGELNPIMVNTSALKSHQKRTSGGADGIGTKKKTITSIILKQRKHAFCLSFKFKNKVHSYSLKLENVFITILLLTFLVTKLLKREARRKKVVSYIN